MPYCYFHIRTRRLAARLSGDQEEPLKLSVLEDSAAIRVALTQVLNALGSSKIDPRCAGLFIRGLQIASRIVQQDPSLRPDTAVPSITYTPEGEELAPERLICQPPEDCPACDRKETCDEYWPE
jgi:hypothetical protein